MREYAYAQGCTEMHTPKLMGTASESGAEVFKLGYFDRSAYLAQSPQFYKQMAIAAGIDKVFEIGPVFRAEPSFTSRHATEFTGVDVEMAWIAVVEDVMAFEEEMLAHAIAKVADAHGEAIAEHFGVEVAVPDVALPARDHGRGATRSCATTAGTGAGRQGATWTRRASAASPANQGATGHEFVFITALPGRHPALLPHAPRRRAGRDPQLRPAVEGHGGHDRRPA